jgi:hypothetical protein
MCQGLSAAGSRTAELVTLQTKPTARGVMRCTVKALVSKTDV